MATTTRLHPLIREALAGADWHIEMGKKHRKLYIDDRLVGIMPRSKGALRQESDMRKTLKLRQQIRRARKEG